MWRLMTATVCVVLALAGCAPSQGVAPSGSVTGGAAQPGEKRSTNQVLRVAQPTLPTVLSPEAGETHRAIFWLMYDNPITLDGNFNVKPWAVERWELTTPTTHRLFVRKGLTFSNGDPLTAADIEYTVKYMLETKTPPLSRFRSLIDAKQIDEYTVDLISKQPDGGSLAALSYLVILPKSYHQQVGKDAFPAKPIGSGPYVLSDFQPNSIARFTLRPTEHPFRKPIPSEIQVRAVPEISAIMAGLRTGEIDLVHTTQFLADQVDTLEKAGLVVNKRLTSNLQISITWYAMETNKTPLRDKRVRQALNYAVDKEALNKKFYRGEADPTGNVVAPGSQFYNPDIKPYPYDVAKAKQLLAEAGYPNGFKLPGLFDFSPQTANADVVYAVQGYLREIGVESNVFQNEYGLFVDKFLGKQPKGDLLATTMPDPDGFNAAARAYYGCEYIPTSAFYCNPEFDRLNNEAAGEPDQAKRVALFRRAADVITTDVHAIYLLNLPSYVVQSPKIKGFEFSAPTFYLLENAYRVD